MAITRMQQPRQLYGLGSFVKRVTRKVTKPFTKVAKKIVPREIAGIMRVAAPFLPPGYREAAYLLGTAKQTGRISPVDLALVLAPQIGKTETSTGQTVSQRLGAIKVPFTGGEAGTNKTLSEFLIGSPAEYDARIGSVTENVMSGEGADRFLDTQKTFFRDPKLTKEATSGLFGEGGKMFQFGKKGGPGIFDTKVGQTLFGQSKDPTKLSIPKVAGLTTSALSLVTAAETPREAGIALANQTGDPDDQARGEELFALLKPGIFDIRPEFRLPAQAGGLMRENYALGTMPTAQESGLGGLPIEADMRYTGGFMPYGAKEKADDVPARLSKNEFVFTADAVRAAGGGSVQKGAQRMYNTMKQLESKPEAKGMMA